MYLEGIRRKRIVRSSRESIGGPKLDSHCFQSCTIFTHQAYVLFVGEGKNDTIIFELRNLPLFLSAKTKGGIKFFLRVK